MLIPVPPKFRRRRGRARPTTQPAGPAALVLQAAEMINFEPPVLRLRFDRAIDVTNLDAGQFTVNYPSGPGYKYLGDAVVGTTAPDTFDLGMYQDEAASGSQDVLDATSATGITAVDDGGTWPGVSNLILPFP